MNANLPGTTGPDQFSPDHTEVFGIERLKLVLGWSMAVGQTYQWAVSHPQMVERMLPFCGSPRTAPHNQVFLQGVRSALTADAAFANGLYRADALPVTGLRAAARVHAGWGFSQASYWHEQWREIGFSSLEDFLVGFWAGFFLDGRDPSNLLSMLDTWTQGDVGLAPGFASTEAALAPNCDRSRGTTGTLKAAASVARARRSSIARSGSCSPRRRGSDRPRTHP